MKRAKRGICKVKYVEKKKKKERKGLINEQQDLHIDGT